MGEARAVLEGVKLAREKGWQEVELEGDSLQLMVELGKGMVDQFFPYGSLVASIIEHSRTFNFFSCSFVKRTDNRLAHALAHISCDSSYMLENSFISADLVSII